MNTIISREDASQFLHSLESYVPEDHRIKLNEICNCIDFERFGFHMWSMPKEDVDFLLNTDEWTDDDIERGQIIEMAMAFTPAAYEKHIIEKSIKYKILTDETEEE